MQESTKLIIDAIKPLADKLGQGAAHLYQIYVRQQYILGVTDYIWAALFVLLAIVTTVVGVKSLQHGNKMKKQDPYSDYEVWLFLWAFSIILVTIAISASAISLQSAIQTTLNPEYYAVQDIINTVKGGR